MKRWKDEAMGIGEDDFPVWEDQDRLETRKMEHTIRIVGADSRFIPVIRRMISDGKLLRFRGEIDGDDI